MRHKTNEELIEYYKSYKEPPDTNRHLLFNGDTYDVYKRIIDLASDMRVVVYKCWEILADIDENHFSK